MSLRKRIPLTERFWKFVRKSEDPNGCWVWIGHIRANGYGTFKSSDRRSLPAHRIAYELSVERVPKGLELDHLCRNRSCVRPSHLEPVTRRENVLRGVGMGARNAKKIICKNGHPFDEKNTVFIKNGWRQCRECRLQRSRSQYEIHRETILERQRFMYLKNRNRVLAIQKQRRIDDPETFRKRDRQNYMNRKAQFKIGGNYDN